MLNDTTCIGCQSAGSRDVVRLPVTEMGCVAGVSALIYADNRLYVRYQNGLMLLVEATPEDYRERGSFLIPDVEKESWSHPVISNGRLYLREQDHLLVYDLRQP